MDKIQKATGDKAESYNVAYPVQTVVTYLLFKKYAEVETKFVQAKVKKKELHKGEKYLNEEFPFKINIIDSTYFTNIVRSEGFKVSGHFALRAHGEGRRERRLVWINDYEKSGYTRTAKKDSLPE